MRFIILIAYLNLISCNSYKNINNRECYFKETFFIIKNEEKKLTPNILSQDLNHSDYTLTDNDIYEDSYYKLGNTYITNTKTKKKLNIQKLIKYQFNGDISRVTYYYLNGNVKIGKETYFDSQGNITKVIDHEKGYKICWAEMIAIMKKRYRSLIRKYEIHTFNLSRVNLNEFPEAKPRWTVTMEGNEAYEQKGYDEGNKHYSFDGVTGEYLYTSTSISVYD